MDIQLHFLYFCWYPTYLCIWWICSCRVLLSNTLNIVWTCISWILIMSKMLEKLVLYFCSTQISILCEILFYFPSIVIEHCIGIGNPVYIFLTCAAIKFILFYVFSACSRVKNTAKCILMILMLNFLNNFYRFPSLLPMWWSIKVYVLVLHNSFLWKMLLWCWICSCQRKQRIL